MGQGRHSAAARRIAAAASKKQSVVNDEPDSAEAVLHAKGDVLRYWAEKVNEREKAKPKTERHAHLKKGGKVDELRERIGQYYHFDLAAARSQELGEGGSSEQISTAASGSNANADSFNAFPDVDEGIRCRQWNFVGDLGVEWNGFTKNGRQADFHLNTDDRPGLPMGPHPHYQNSEWHPVPGVMNARLDPELAELQAQMSRMGMGPGPAASSLSSQTPIGPLGFFGGLAATPIAGQPLTPAMCKGLEVLGTFFNPELGFQQPANPLNAMSLPAGTEASGTSQLPSQGFPSPNQLSYSPLASESSGFDSTAATPSPFAQSIPLPFSTSAQNPTFAMPTQQPFPPFRPSVTAAERNNLSTGVASSSQVAMNPPDGSMSESALSNPAAPSVEAALASCLATPDLVNIDRADDGLPGVIRLLESGQVKRFREAYGPPDGRRNAKPEWHRHKKKITRYEQIQAQLQEHFNNDSAAFLAFFTVPSQPTNATSGNGLRRKRKHNDNEPQYRSFRLVAEAITRMRDDIAEEMALPRYAHEGTSTFDYERWRQHWGERNNWEIWRALGKERYGKHEATG
ncbi:hypothetical protein EIP91_006035 [Steccherinum ochraceum]|uniref:Uncharacterized protein n=1 Tax=Steccherinum ochraceum TaxID=92696 RepID=A0A4R0REQ8_9APHY|nr:hypothetical protein EIP91_006035 [Steccherinum ochraceum]